MENKVNQYKIYIKSSSKINDLVFVGRLEEVSDLRKYRSREYDYIAEVKTHDINGLVKKILDMTTITDLVFEEVKKE